MTIRVWGATLLAIGLTAALAQAQETGTVQGRIVEADGVTPVQGVSVSLVDGIVLTASNADGRYRVELATGPQLLRFEAIAYQVLERAVEVRAGAATTLDATLVAQPFQLGEVRVTAVSRWRQDLVTAPAAVGVVGRERAGDLAPTGQTPRLLAQLPGVHAAQSGIHDYNLNTRGFNTLLNRRLLVLVDGRDISLPLLGNLEWSALPLLEDDAQIEVVRGPGSALYGANAFSGVVNIVTAPVRETPGSRLSLGAGELATTRIDGRHAAVSSSGRWAYRFNAGYYRSETWDRSRTNLGDLAEEYAGIDGIDINVAAPGYEVQPLRGQEKEGPFGLPGEASGVADPVENTHGSARLDWYGDAGRMLTVEGGNSWVRNQVFTSQLGRSQVYEASRPWARIGWVSDQFKANAYYTGRVSDESYSLASSALNRERSGTFHLEAFRDGRFDTGRARYVVGGSVRTISIDSEGTLLSIDDDGRSDQYYALFGQLDYQVSPTVKLVAAARYDASTLVPGQVSPKFAAVFSPSADHSFRATVNRAYQTASALEAFISLPAGLPLDLSALEAGLRASPLGPALAGVEEGSLFTTSSAVPILALGNDALEPVKVWGFEAGYKGRFDDRTFITLDLFYSRLEDFLTNLLPGVNPAFAPWTAPSAVPDEARGAVEGAAIDALGSGLTRLPDGTTAVVLSIGNAGRAQEWGLEFGAGVLIASGVRLDANYTYFDSNVEARTFVSGDSLLANTPQHRANLIATYDNRDLRARAALQWVDSYQFLAGAQRGLVPSSQTVEVSLRYRINRSLSAGAVGTNLFDQRRYHVYGGSIIGRRLLASLSWTR